MAELFYDHWVVEVVAKDAVFGQRFRIVGSDASDGDYPSQVGTGVSATGQGWSVIPEWNDNAGSGWQLSAVRRNATFTKEYGLVVELGADDNVEALRDRDYDDMIIKCRCLDPSLHPLHPMVNPYDFRLPGGGAPDRPD